jgi:hypothetical protein
MPRFSARRFSVWFGLSAALGAAASCSAGGDPGHNGSRLGQAGSAANTSASAGTGNLITSPSGGGPNLTTENGGGGNTTDAGCQHVEVNFVPKIPTVFVLVDRSDSMFVPDNKTQVASWEPLKAGVLSVVQQLQDQVRFGFGAFTGQQGGMCPIFDSIAPALNNASAISAVYPTGRVAGATGETPVIMVLPLLEALLDQPGNDGDKYVLFVTDGEPDFCDNGDSKCAMDAVIAGVQKLASNKIHTLVFGIGSSIIQDSSAFLQAVANAGASLPVATPYGATTKEQDVCYACKGVQPWLKQWPAGTMPDANCMGAGSQTLATYGAAATNATVYHPDPANQAALTAELAKVVSGIKSCTFDLGGDISVNLALLDQASVAIEGQTLPLSQDNGWRMNSPTQVELVGSACATWNDPKNTKIDFNFPCDIIVVK